MTIRNFPEHMNSRLRNNFSVTYCYSSDAKKFGYSAILAPLLADLKALKKRHRNECKWVTDYCVWCYCHVVGE
jgi:hypothetical protein